MVLRHGVLANWLVKCFSLVVPNMVLSKLNIQKLVSQHTLEGAVTRFNPYGFLIKLNAKIKTSALEWIQSSLNQLRKWFTYSKLYHFLLTFTLLPLIFHPCSNASSSILISSSLLDTKIPATGTRSLWCLSSSFLHTCWLLQQNVLIQNQDAAACTDFRPTTWKM